MPWPPATNIREVVSLARMAERYSLPLVALGAETSHRRVSGEGAILLRFDLELPPMGYRDGGADVPPDGSEPILLE